MLGSMRATSLILPWRVAVYGAFTLGAPWAHAVQTPESPSSAEVNTVRQIRALASQTPDASYSFRLEGDVWWANPVRGELVLKDDTGAEELEMDLAGQALAAGQRVHLEGNGTITPTGPGFRLGANGPVVDNDGVHGMVEKSGAVYLKAGRNPIRLEWFNGVERFGLEAQYEGPGLSRRKIPDSALFRQQTNPATGAGNWVHGLDFRCCGVSGQVLPDFQQLPALRTGVTDNFDLSVMTQPEHVGLCFTGYLEVAQAGLYWFYLKSDDGSRLFAGEPSFQARVIGRAALPKAEPLIIGQTWRERENSPWVEVTGKVTFVSQEPDGLKLELSAGTGRMRAEVGNDTELSSAILLNRRVRATGFCQSVSNGDGQGVPGVLLVPDRSEIVLLPTPAEAGESMETNAGGLPLLVTAAEVHRLKREEAQRGYPVKIQGVITSVLPEHQAFTVQDGTRGLYVVDFSESRSHPPRIGEYLEVEGVTDPSLFAPIVYARRVRGLGLGELPDPVHPSRDQLHNGSLDAQYVEIQGVLTSVQADGVNLLTPDGLIKTDLRVTGLRAEELTRYEDALIRVRGCLFATWDYVTHRVRVGEIRIYGAEVTVEQPAPADLFSAPRKTVSELLLFDPQAGVFQRVKVTGQIIHVRGPECFMMDGNNGVRFIPKRATGLEAGDWVEVAGFPELSSASPVLREAVARKTGHSALPKARTPRPGDLILSDLDSTLVQVEALLVNQRNTAEEQALEMRVGLRTFLAWLPGKGEEARSIPAGSRLELTGTYASLGGSRPGSQDVASFELLLNSATDIAVLARPPWWTLARLLVMLGALACVLAVTVLWITQLRRKVEQRTAELEDQIRERQRVEQQHALEQERARIAQDLHDELGSGLTEISMLGARARSASAPVEKRGRHLEQMGEKARQMVTALDEIVWAMNPTHDSLASMVSYFSLYAERFLGLANIAWRFEAPLTPVDQAVDSRRRHQLFLAFKEGLTNVVRHSGATEVRVSIQVEQGHILLTIADNGRGLPPGGPTEEMDGVANMRDRLEKLGGRFEVKSQAGQGTIVRFDLPAH
jgi:signal transduction histidine kinase